MLFRWTSLLWLLIGSLGMVVADLDEFESGFESSSSKSSSGSSSSDVWDEWVFDMFWDGVVGAGQFSFLVAEERPQGHPVLPVAKLDLGWQWVDSEVDAWVVGGETGYGPFALEGRWTGFRQQGDEVETLDFVQLHGIYRMSIHPAFEWGIGFGTAWLKGDESRASFSMILPVRYWFHRNWGVELRPAWTQFNDVGLTDVEVTCVYRMDMLNLSAGYRWVTPESDVRDLNGFRVGIGYRF